MRKYTQGLIALALGMGIGMSASANIADETDITIYTSNDIFTADAGTGAIQVAGRDRGRGGNGGGGRGNGGDGRGGRGGGGN